MRAYLAHPKHGPLPGLLLLLTVAVGVVDAVSVLALGRVFVANMTGNVVFIGFAIAGTPGFALSASLSVLGGFLVGAAAGGAAVARRGARRAALLRDTVLVELGLLTAALVVLAIVEQPVHELPASVIAALAATALGAQNAVVRHLAVPDLTTTVLTMTLTGIVADMRTRDWPTTIRRLLAVTAMLLGALIGAVLVRQVYPEAAMALVVGLVAVVGAALTCVCRRSANWQVGTVEA